MCGGDGGSCDSDEDCQKSCVEGTCGEEEVDQGEGLEENEIDLTEEEVEQLVEELSNLGSILAGRTKTACWAYLVLILNDLRLGK